VTLLLFLEPGPQGRRRMGFLPLVRGPRLQWAFRSDEKEDGDSYLSNKASCSDTAPRLAAASMSVWIATP
jgi:hypothetical protein